MSTVYEVPLTPESQQMSIALAGVTYQLTVRWNEQGQFWVIDIADDTGVYLVTGIPLVTGIDLLSPYTDMSFGGTLTVSTDGDANAIPTYDNLGDTSHLYFTVP